ncbi:MAG TPA: hypothetical protein VF585_02455 [Chthoniobacterales bacterium]|jgi:hypothetical protein
MALLLAGLPLRSLTRPTVPLPPVPLVENSKETITIEVTLTKPAEKFSVQFLGQEIIARTNDPSFDASTTVETHFPKEGIDLVFEGTWPGYFSKVGASIRVTRADGSQQTQTLWGKRTLFDVLTFPGKEPL